MHAADCPTGFWAILINVHFLYSNYVAIKRYKMLKFNCKYYTYLKALQSQDTWFAVANSDGHTMNIRIAIFLFWR